MRGRRALVAKGTATLAGAGRTWLFVRLEEGHGEAALRPRRQAPGHASAEGHGRGGQRHPRAPHGHPRSLISGIRRLAELPARSVATTVRRATTRRRPRRARRAARSSRPFSLTVSVTPPPATVTRRRLLISGSESPAASRKPDAAIVPRSFELAAIRIRAAAAESLHGGPARLHLRLLRVVAGAEVPGRRGREDARHRLAVLVRDLVHGVGLDPVEAAAADDVVGEPVARAEIVVAVLAGQPVEAEPCLKHIVPGTAGDPVVAVAAVHLVVAAAARERVVAVVTGDRVRGVAAGDRVRPEAAGDRCGDRQGGQVAGVLPIAQADPKAIDAHADCTGHLHDPRIRVVRDLVGVARPGIHAAVHGGVSQLTRLPPLTRALSVFREVASAETELSSPPLTRTSVCAARSGRGAPGTPRRPRARRRAHGSNTASQLRPPSVVSTIEPSLSAR